MADTDPNELVWMRHDELGFSTFPAWAVSNREDHGWAKVTAATAAKHGYALPGDTAPTAGTAPSTAQEG